MKKRSSIPRSPNAAKAPKEPKLSRTHAPAEMTPVEWQRALRRQFGREQAFDLENIGAEPFFSEFRVSNPQSKSAYRVAIRGKLPGDNFCSCPDCATNELGTCKHIEFALATLEKKRGAKSAFVRGYHPPFSAFAGNGRKNCRCAFNVGEHLAGTAPMTKTNRRAASRF